MSAQLNPETARLFDMRTGPESWQKRHRQILGEKLEACCRYRDVNPVTLSVRMGRYGQHVHQLRSYGTVSTSKECLELAATLLGVELDYLYDTNPGTLEDFYNALAGREAALTGSTYEPRDRRQVRVRLPEMRFLEVVG